MEDNADISSLLEFSRQQDELIEGHQKEMRQVLDNSRHLRSALAQAQAQLAQQSNEIQTLLTDNAQKDTRIKELEARVAELEARPQFQVEQYIEQQHIGQQYYAVQRPIARKKHAINPSNQLPLWEHVSFT